MEQIVKKKEESQGPKTQGTFPDGDDKLGVGTTPAPIAPPKEVEQPLPPEAAVKAEQLKSAATPPKTTIDEKQMRQSISIWHALPVLSILMPIAFFAYCWWSYSRVSPGLDIREFGELEKAALQISLDTSHSLANLTVALMGGVWALILGSENRLKQFGWRFVPLIGGSISMILSYICYRMGLSRYIEMLLDAQTIDISAGFVKLWPTWQAIFFGYGFFIFVIALLTIYRRS